MRLKSTCSLVAMVGLAVAVAEPASALIITPFIGGPFSSANPFGTFIPLAVNSNNTYDFTFSIVGPTVDVLTQMQASTAGASQSLQFSLFSGAPGSGVLLDTSPDELGPSLTDTLSAGDYFLEIESFSRGPGPEIVSGGLVVTGIPEPASWGLMLLGVAGLGGALRLTRARPAVVTGNAG